MIVVADASARDPEASRLLDELSEALAAITGDSGRNSFDLSDAEEDRSAFVVARDASGRAIGCGALRALQPQIAELKRMYAQPGSKGVGAAVLAFLEDRAREIGYSEIWLETRLVNSRAIRFYEQRGYRPIPNFGKYVGRPEAVCFAKFISRADP